MKKQHFRTAAKIFLAGAAFLTAFALPAARGFCAPAGENGSAVCYEVFVYSFYDGDGDGIGDLKGLTEKLDYINDGNPQGGEDLGCDMIWLMPIFPSPTYHKYDATDYFGIDPEYGSLEDFDTLVRECHDRGVRLILDLAVNHTSSGHPWFLAAADYLRGLPAGEEPSAEDCPYVDYYCFSDEQKSGYEPLPETRFFYEARFWSGMPDLNLDSEAVRGELAEVTGFWQQRGVDGFRLDAVTSYYSEDQEAGIAFTKWLTETVKEQNPDAYLVAEAWTSQESYAEYYSSGIDSMFDFAFAGAEGVIAPIVRGKKDASIYGKRLAAEETLYASVREDYINAPFYTNHDMARSAGYYPRDDGSRVKLAQALNLLMPGQAFLYYGEELGMRGSGKDENKRAPMYWSADAPAAGMCAGPPEMEPQKMLFPSEEEQAEDSLSILNYVRKVIALRADYPAIADGKTEQVKDLSGKRLCTLIRSAEGEEPVLLVISTDEEQQIVELGKTGEQFPILTAGLSVSDAQPSLTDGTLILPPFGIALLTKEGSEP